MLLSSMNDKNSELRLLSGELRLLRKQQAETRAKLSAQSLEVGRLQHELRHCKQKLDEKERHVTRLEEERKEAVKSQARLLQSKHEDELHKHAEKARKAKEDLEHQKEEATQRQRRLREQVDAVRAYLSGLEEYLGEVLDSKAFLCFVKGVEERLGALARDHCAGAAGELYAKRSEKVRAEVRAAVKEQLREARTLKENAGRERQALRDARGELEDERRERQKLQTMVRAYKEEVVRMKNSYDHLRGSVKRLKNENGELQEALRA